MAVVHPYCGFLCSVSATAERPIHNRVFGQFCRIMRKDSIANYGSIWMHRWRHKIRKYAAEIFPNLIERRLSAIEIAINSTRGAQHFALHPAGIATCLGDDAFGF